MKFWDYYQLRWWQYPLCALMWVAGIVICAVAFIPMLIAAIWMKPGDGSHVNDYYAMLAERERKSRA